MDEGSMFGPEGNGFERLNLAAPRNLIEEIMDRLCRWYDTEVFYANDDVRKKRFTGIIARFTDVADVLHLIGETATVQFDLKGDVITVSDSR